MGLETQKLEKWLGDNLPDLLSCAIAVHEMAGRGAVVLDVTKIAGRSFKQIHIAGEMVYVPANSTPLKDRDIQRMLRDYDPRTEVVVVFRKPGSGNKGLKRQRELFRVGSMAMIATQRRPENTDAAAAKGE